MNSRVQLLRFSLDRGSYALSLAQVECVVQAVAAAPLPMAFPNVLGVISYRGAILPVLDVRRRFGLPSREIRATDEFIVVRNTRRSIVLVVDRVNGIVECPAEDITVIDFVVPGLEQVAGIVQLEDGLTVIHDLDRFLSLDEEHQLAQALAG